MPEDLETAGVLESASSYEEPAVPVTEIGILARRFWVGLALSLPVFVLSAREALGARYFEPFRFYGNYFIQAALSGGVIIWAGDPVFWRFKSSAPLLNAGNFNLVRLGILGAWIFSFAGVAFFPMLGRHTIEPVPVFFDSAALITLLALRVQMRKTKQTVKNNPHKNSASDFSAPDRYESIIIALAVLTFALWLCLGTNPRLLQAPEKAAARAVAAAVAVLIAAAPPALNLANSNPSQLNGLRKNLFAIIYSAAVIPIAAVLFCFVCGPHPTPMLAGFTMTLASLCALTKSTVQK